MVKLEEILAEWATDSAIDKANLDVESINTSKLHSKYLQILTALKRRHTQKKLELEELKALKTMWYSGKMSKNEMDRLGWPYDPWRGSNRPLKSDLSIWLDSDQDLTQAEAALKELELARDAVMDIMNSINWRHQHVRNAIDWMKFTSGY